MQQKVLRGLSLAFGTLLLIHAGSSLIFSVYTNAVKTKYQYTQSEMAVITGFATFGAYCGWPGGILVGKLGPRWVSLMNALLCLVGYLFLWSATLMTSFYRRHSWLLCVYFFLATYSGISAYIASLSCNVYNFHPKYRGTAIGYFESVFSLGTSVFVAIYGASFINGHYSNEGQQDIGDFFLMLAVTGAAVNVLGAMFLGQYPTITDYSELDGTESGCPEEALEQQSPDVHGVDKEESSLSGVDVPGFCDEETQKSDFGVGTTKSHHGPGTEKSGRVAGMKESVQSGAGDQSKLGVKSPEHPVDITGIALLKTLDFQLLFWCSLFSLWVVNMFLMNVNVYLKSFNFETYSTAFNILLPVIATISKVLIGRVSDAILCTVPRAVVYLLANIVVFLSVVASIFFANNFVFFLWMTAVAGFSLAATCSLVGAMISESYGLKHYGSNWGAILTFGGLGSVALMKVFGILYDAEITEPHAIFCYGLKCYRGSFTIAAVLSGCSVILNSILIRRQRRISIQ